MAAGPMHALHRAVADLTIGVAKNMRARDERDAQMGLTEIQQQFRVEISGDAGLVWGFATTEIEFDFPFYFAPGQRDPDFEEPHFWYGAVADADIAIMALVKGWTSDPDNGAIVGATVSVGVQAGLVSAYTGVVHLTFQGFSALSEAETDITE